MLNTLDQWLDYIGRQHSAEIVMGLDRVRAVWEQMDRPAAPVNIVVGGTNGKGSTCAMLESILHVAGFKTGFYSSPHLIRYNERVRIDAVDADDTQLVASFAAVERARMLASPPLPLTYFEYATLSALWLFHQQLVDVAILEVGLGGRLDAVNIVDADVSIVVSVDLDHQAYLGNTRELIGREKAHIYRAGRPAIFADSDPPQSLLDYAGEIGADLRLLNRDFRSRRMDGQWQFFGRDSARHALPFPALRGSYQLKNAAAALAALEALRERLPVTQQDVKRGLLEVAWPGRMQVLPGRPTVVLDVAHNPHAVAALTANLDAMGFFPVTHAVLGVMADKDLAAMLARINPLIDKWYFTDLPIGRASSANALLATWQAQNSRKDVSASTHADPESALQAALADADPADRIVVFGSFHTVGGVLKDGVPRLAARHLPNP